MPWAWSGGAGKRRDLDGPQAGGARFELDNKDRRFEPDYSAGAYAGNIVPLRRFRVTITADSTDYTQGIYYASSWTVSAGGRLDASTVVVECVDGYGILSLDTLPTLTPPTRRVTATSSWQSDNPVAVFPMDEEVGGEMTALVGTSGKYKGGPIDHVLGNDPSSANPDSGSASQMGAGMGVPDWMIKTSSRMRAAFTVECVVTTSRLREQHVHPTARGSPRTADWHSS